MLFEFIDQYFYMLIADKRLTFWKAVGVGMHRVVVPVYTDLNLPVTPSNRFSNMFILCSELVADKMFFLSREMV